MSPQSRSSWRKYIQTLTSTKRKQGTMYVLVFCRFLSSGRLLAGLLCADSGPLIICGVKGHKALVYSVRMCCMWYGHKPTCKVQKCVNQSLWCLKHVWSCWCSCTASVLSWISVTLWKHQVRWSSSWSSILHLHYIWTSCRSAWLTVELFLNTSVFFLSFIRVSLYCGFVCGE